MLVLYLDDLALIFRKKSLLDRKRRIRRISSLAILPPSGYLRYWLKKKRRSASWTLQDWEVFHLTQVTPFLFFCNSCCNCPHQVDRWQVCGLTFPFILCYLQPAPRPLIVQGNVQQVSLSFTWTSLIGPRRKEKDPVGTTFSFSYFWISKKRKHLFWRCFWNSELFLSLFQTLPTFFYLFSSNQQTLRIFFDIFGGCQVGVCDGGMLRVGGGQRDQKDQRRYWGAAAQRQEGLPQGAEAAAVRWASLPPQSRPGWSHFCLKKSYSLSEWHPFVEGLTVFHWWLLPDHTWTHRFGRWDSACTYSKTLLECNHTVYTSMKVLFDESWFHILRILLH